MNRIVFWLAGFVSILAWQLSANAAQLMYFEENGGSGQPRGFYNFDTDTGVSTLRTTVPGTERFFAMDFRPSDGKAFAISGTFATPNPGGLFSIDINTGDYTLIGQTGITQMLGLAFHPTTGELFGLDHNDGQNGRLFSINPSNGNATLIGNTGIVRRGLAFAPSGELFGFSEGGDLYRVNPATGSVAAVGGSGNPIFITFQAEDSAFTADGVLYGTAYNGEIYRTDTVTGDGVLIGTTGLGWGLLAMTPFVPVPEPSSVLLSALGLVGFAAWGYRRRCR